MEKVFVVAVSTTQVNKAGVRYWTGKGWSGRKGKARRYAHACNAKGVITANGLSDTVHTRYFVDTVRS